VTDPALTVRFEALNRETDRIKSYKIQSSYLVSTDGFDFVLVEKDLSLIRGLEMQPVELLISGPTVVGAQQALGRIDITDIGGDGIALTCEGRDYVSDMVENHVDPEFNVAKDTPLAAAIVQVGAPVGIDTVWSNGDVGMRNIRTGKAPGNPAPADFSAIKLTDLKPQSGLGSYEWANRVAARNGVTIQPGGNRNELYLSAPDYQQTAVGTLRRSLGSTQAGRNTIAKGRARRDYSKFPTHTLFTGKAAAQGKGKPAPLKFEAGTRSVIDALGNAELLAAKARIVDGRRKPSAAGELADFQLYRLLYQQESESKKREQLERAATRAFSERFKDTLVYTCSVKGHELPDGGAVYGVNTVLNIQDELTDVNEPMWVASRTLSYSENGGAETELEFWRLGAFQI